MKFLGERPAVYGLMAEFEDPTSLVHGDAQAPTTKATAAWTPTRRSRSKSCTKRSGRTTRGCR